MGEMRSETCWVSASPLLFLGEGEHPQDRRERLDPGSCKEQLQAFTFFSFFLKASSYNPRLSLFCCCVD